MNYYTRSLFDARHRRDNASRVLPETQILFDASKYLRSFEEALGTKQRITYDQLIRQHQYHPENSNDSGKFGKSERYLHGNGNQLILIHRKQAARSIKHATQPGQWTHTWTHYNAHDGEQKSGHTLLSLYRHLKNS